LLLREGQKVSGITVWRRPAAPDRLPSGASAYYQREAGGVERGDLIVLPAPDGSGVLLRRLIGLPGDRVTCCDRAGLVTVDGEPLQEDYLTPGTASSQPAFAVTLGPVQIWVMADNRDHAYDSTEWGAQPASAIQGRVIQVSVPGSGHVSEQPPATFITDGLATGQGNSPLPFVLVGTGVIGLVVLIIYGVAGVILWAVRRRRRKRFPPPPQPTYQAW
jgi:signal peptidase I